MIQRKYLYPLVLVVMLVSIWTIGWFWLARVIQTSLEDYAARQSGNPSTIAWEAIDVTGYPTRFFAQIIGPRSTWSAPDGDIEWAGPTTKLEFLTDF